jgi:hypothetical protein
MSVPYNTGKVKIGSKYVPPNPNYMDRDSELIQSAMLGQAMDFNEKDDSFMDVVCKLLIIFIVILFAFLINWIIART